METLPTIEGEVVEGVTQGYSSQTTLFSNTTLAISDRKIGDVNVARRFLDGKRSKRTHDAYKTDFRAFFGKDLDPEKIAEFLSWPASRIVEALEAHKAQMIQDGKSESSVNRRLAAMRSLLEYAFRLGISQTDGRGLIKSEKSRSYRDTRGLEVENVKTLLRQPQKVHAKKAESKRVLILRDTAMFVLFLENGLRSAELRNLAQSDFSPTSRRLMILGKGRGTQKEPVTMSTRCTKLIVEYMSAAGHLGEEGAIFRNLDHNPKHRGKPMSKQAVWKIVKAYGAAMGIQLNPHKLRHTAITNVLIQNNGNIVAAQEFSRHIDPKIIMRYWHNAQNLQGDMTDLLSDLFADDDD